MKNIIGVILVIHGLITAAQGLGAFTPAKSVPNPGWLSGWPVSLGQSWLLSSLRLEKSPIAILTGVLWLIAGAAITAAGLGLVGFIIPVTLWRTLAGAGAALSLLLFVIYAHPFYLIGFGADIAILVVLLWAKWPAPAVLGS